MIENQDAVVSAMLTALVDYYAAERKHLGWWARRVTHASQFKDMVGPTTVHVISVAHAGLAYVGFEFGCSWDGEHGLGWMTHKTRIVEVGSADTSFLEWIAENDADAQKG